MISHSRNEKDTWIGTNVKRKRLQIKDKEYIRHRDLNSQPTNAMTDDFLTLIVSIFNFFNTAFIYYTPSTDSTSSPLPLSLSPKPTSPLSPLREESLSRAIIYAWPNNVIIMPGT